MYKSSGLIQKTSHRSKRIKHALNREDCEQHMLMTPPDEAVMFHNSYDKAQFELIGGKLAADTMVDRVTPLGLSVLGLLWTLGKSKKSEVYDLIHRDHTTVTHNVTRLIDDGYVDEQVISRKLKYISLSDKGKEFYTLYIEKAKALTRELRRRKTGSRLAPPRYVIDLGF